jgi:hypothetical protein
LSRLRRPGQRSGAPATVRVLDAHLFTAHDARGRLHGPDLARADGDLLDDHRLLVDVAAEVRFIGTHTGPLARPGGELPLSGKHIDMQAADVLTASGGADHLWRVYIRMGTVMD